MWVDLQLCIVVGVAVWVPMLLIINAAVKKYLGREMTQAVNVEDVVKKRVEEALKEMMKSLLQHEKRKAGKLCEDVLAEAHKVNERTVVLQEDPKVPYFNGKNMDVRRWIRQIDIAFWQMDRTEEEKVRFMLKHLEGPAEIRMYNCRDDWVTVSDLKLMLVRVYGPRLSVLEWQQEMMTRMKREGETLWEFLDAMLELNEELKHMNAAYSKCLLGRRIAMNLNQVELRMMLMARMEEHPEESIDQWIDWLTQRERELEVSVEEPKDSKTIVVDTKSHVGSQNMAEPVRKKIVCYMCRKEGHVRRQCPRLRAKVSQGVDARVGTANSNVGSWSMGQTSRKRMICYACREDGHIRTQCPQARYVGTAGPVDRAMQRQLQLEYLAILRAKGNVHGVFSAKPRNTSVGGNRPQVATWKPGGDVDDGRTETEVNECGVIINSDVSLKSNVKVSDMAWQSRSISSRPRGKG